MARRIPKAHLYELAKRGAEARVQDLIHEVNVLFGVFPHLRDSFDPDELPIPFILAKGSRRSPKPKARGRRRKMSAAARKAVSERMKKYCTKPLRGSYFSHQLSVAA